MKFKEIVNSESIKIPYHENFDFETFFKQKSMHEEECRRIKRKIDKKNTTTDWKWFNCGCYEMDMDMLSNEIGRLFCLVGKNKHGIVEPYLNNMSNPKIFRSLGRAIKYKQKNKQALNYKILSLKQLIMSNIND